MGFVIGRHSTAGPSSAGARANHKDGLTYGRQSIANSDAVLRFVAFAGGFLRSGDTVLELGSGEGDVARRLSALDSTGTVVGADISYQRLLWGRARTDDCHVPILVADATELPLCSSSVDIVCCFDLLEHVRPVDRALREIIRVLRRGGRVVIAGPNLLSPLFSICSILGFVRGSHGFPLIGRRRRGFFSPFGNHLLSSVAILFRNMGYLAATALARVALFFYRRPDLSQVAHGDSDAEFLCNPLAIAKFFRCEGLSIVSYQRVGRTGWLGALAGGTWIVAEKN